MNLISLILLFIGAYSVSALEDIPVVFADDTNYKDLFSRADHSIIYFYRDGCIYCKNFEKDFYLINYVYNNVSSSSGLIQVLKVNGKENDRLRNAFSVTEFPTIAMWNQKTRSVLRYTGWIDLDYILNFIEKELEIEPDFSRIDTRVHYLHENSTDFDFSQDTVVIFTMPYLPDWLDYMNPAHFVHKLADDERWKDINIAIFDVSKGGYLPSEKFKISNFPSIIYFSKDKRLKTYNTNSQNYLKNSRLDKNAVVEFLSNLDERTTNASGTWFSNLDALVSSANDTEVYEGHKYKRQGFHLRQDTESSGYGSIESDYYSLMDEVTL